MKINDQLQSVYSNQDIFDLIYQGHIDLLPKLNVESEKEIEAFSQHSGITFNSNKADSAYWFLPEEYKNLDIEGYLVHVCPKENYQRLIEELQEFRARDMINLLRWLKYFVDTCRKQQIVWGVGRGSSVASYVLFLIGVHKIDSIKYKLDWREFLR
jgi:DNA polymerase III alpha subunit